MSQKTSSPNPIGKILGQFSASHSTAVNKLIHYITIPLVSFSVLALVWAIPFPSLSFLGRYNGFINWASILIGFAVYYYYRVSPLLSYGILIMIFAFSGLIVSLEKFHIQGGGPQMHIIPLLILLPALLAQVAGHRSERAIPSASSSIRSLMDGPLWVMNALFRRLRIIK
ncbi:Mpo1-like protein [Arcticibacter eurypsychrophilus]|uniref:Mpo1-like protein n=1 Tax=Arcticibacter eurypsychrophilus TaxID=1434752 RepID=UPI00084DA9CB|nr:Mpo1-like protein [Arcticibacter eurypsychrophilus]